MFAEYLHDYGVACCDCARCTGRGDEEAASLERGYYVPDPPKIPTRPGIPDPPKIPLPPGGVGGPSTTAAPSEPPGYSGPRFHTLLRGDDWNGAQVGASVLVPYSFATRNFSFYALAGSAPGPAAFDSRVAEALDAAQRNSIREALALWEQVCGITFVEIPDPSEMHFGGIRFLLEDIGEPSLLGLALPSFLVASGEAYSFNIFANRVTYADNPFSRGTDAFITPLHEIGHAIGLKHPFHGAPNLSRSEDNTRNTVMSYTDGGNYANLGPLDADAAQHIYGTREAAAAAPIRWAHGPGGSLITYADDQPNSIACFDNNDVVYGGGGNDYIAARGGDDHVVGGIGHDTVVGGAGADTLHAGWLWRQAWVTLGPDQGTVALPDGTDTYHQVETLRFVDGDLALHGGGAAGQAHRLYGAALGRAPDAMGLGFWANLLETGAASLTDAAVAFAGSAEFAARFGAPDDAGFVRLLYANVLGRVPNAAEVNAWLGVMQNAGVGRSGVLLGFSESPENAQRTAAFFNYGVWLANPEAVDALRGYVAVLDRLPDAAGLAGWTAMREAGLAQFDLIGGFVASEEFQIRFGGLSNRDFVEQLYRTALDRPSDAAGLDAWTQMLDAGVHSRTAVAFGFANSFELSMKLAPLVAEGILLA